MERGAVKIKIRERNKNFNFFLCINYCLNERLTLAD